MRRDDLWLADILDSAGAIEGYTAGLTLEAFLASDMVRDAVLMRLVGIGEACAAVSADVKERHPEVPCQKVKNFRNLAVAFKRDHPDALSDDDLIKAIVGRKSS